MSYRSFLSLCTAAVAAALITGCAKAPQTELSSAKAALDSAKAAQADIYVAQVYLAASDSLKAANVEIEKQKSSGIFGINYDHAKALIASANALALDAKATAAAEKAKVGAELDSLKNELNTAIAKTSKPVGKKK